MERMKSTSRDWRFHALGALLFEAWFADFAPRRYEKEFDGVMDVFELQVC